MTTEAERIEAIKVALADEPLIVSGIRRDLEHTPKGRGGELRFTPATSGHGYSGCPGDNLTSPAKPPARHRRRGSLHNVFASSLPRQRPERTPHLQPDSRPRRSAYGVDRPTQHRLEPVPPAQQGRQP